jgi:quercetin dioxygenase-like cupin family protein
LSYTRQMGEVTAAYRPIADVPALERRSTVARFIAPGSATDGEFGLFRWEMQPHAGGPAAHFHRTYSESFYILDGTVRLYDGARWVAATAGDFLFVPRGGIHAFANESDASATMLLLFAPGAPRERYFEELAEIETTRRQLTPEEWTELYARHDQVMV